MTHVTLLQPRHSYAPNSGQGHIYTNTSLWTAGARLIQAGIEVDFQDENIRPFELKSEFVGVNLLGAPYIPLVRSKIRNALYRDIHWIVGGQVVNGLVEKNLKTGETISREQLEMLFGRQTVNGNDDDELAATLGIRTGDLPPVMNTSLIPAYDKISDDDMQEYLSREISFFVSQGCEKSCAFCPAVRTFIDPVTKQKKRVKEEYRSADIMEKDLRYLVERAKKLGLRKLELYLTNLDLLQTPEKLFEFAGIVRSISQSHPDFSLGMRGLACVDSFIKIRKDHDRVLPAMMYAGLHTVGYGIDGGTPEIWASIRKGHNTPDNCINAIKLSREEFGLTPEVLMVFGHQKDTRESIQKAIAFTKDMAERYGATPRPHVAKDIVPGNEHWRDPVNEDRVTDLIAVPKYFQATDFTALPSQISHPDSGQRRLIWDGHVEMLKLPGNTTPKIFPQSPEFSDEENECHRQLNIGQYDR